MKIISPFHDYYDSVLKYENENDSIVYKREPLEFEIRKLDTTKKSDLIVQILNNYHPLISKYHYDWNIYSKIKWSIIYPELRHYKFEHYKLLIIFCGKIYKGVEFVKTSLTDYTITKTYFYNFDDLEDYLNKHKILFKNTLSRNNIKNYFNIGTLEHNTEFLIKNKITIGVIVEDRSIYINCKLSTYDFYKIFDTFSAFQELNMWLTGTLAYPPNIMVEVSNDSKIEKAGFDKKLSFRKKPTKRVTKP